MGNKSKNASTFSNKEQYQPPAVFDRAKFDFSKFDKDTAEEIKPDWDNKSKNASTF